MNWPRIADAYTKFSWIYTRVILYVMAGILILWMVLWLCAFLFMVYNIVVRGGDEYPVVALPAMAVGLLVAGGLLWLVLWAIRKSRGGAASPLARWTGEIERSIKKSRAFRILIAIAVAGSVAQIATAAAMGLHAWLAGAPIGWEPDAGGAGYPVAFVAGFTLFASGFASIATTLLAGIPLYLVSRRYGYTSLWHHVAAGVALAGIGAGLYVVMRLSEDPPVFWEINPTTIATLYLLACPLATTVFWVIARPDRAATMRPASPA